MRGIDYLLIRSDGITVVDAHAVISTDAGQNISTHTQGYVTSPPEVQRPPPEVILSSEFRWPDVPLPLHGFVLCKTSVEELLWMNRTALVSEGAGNMGTGKLVIETWVTHPTVAEQVGLSAS